MSLRSLLTEIVDRRIENGALITVEDFTFRAAHDCRLSPEGEKLVEMAESIGTTRLKLIDLRRWAQAVTKESNERLKQEMTSVFTLNEARDRVLSVQRMSKGEAASSTKVIPGGDLLDLDNSYGGLLVRGIYVFVSDAALERGVQEYGAAALKGLIEEQLAG